MRLIFVHGMRQEGIDPVALRNAWEASLLAAWHRDGLEKPDYELVMPYYGDELERLTLALKGAGRVLARGTGREPVATAFEADLLEAYRRERGITDEDIRKELGQEVVARGPANWEWVQATARLLERIPFVGELALNFVAQVDAYFDRPHIRQAIDAIVSPSFFAGPCVVVAHSLGTIVSYRLLTKGAPGANVPLFVTLGSPLGIPTVAKKLTPPRNARPGCVARWINGTDQRDYVALHAKLEGYGDEEQVTNFANLKNRVADAHSIIDYLAHPPIAVAIHEALRAG